MIRTEIKNVFDIKFLGKKIKISGWVRFKRQSKNVSFINLNDGSTINNIQIVLNEDIKPDILDLISTGTSISVYGTLIKSEGAGQEFEVIAKSVEILGVADPNQYPLQPKRHSLDFLRENAHLRFRTNTFGAIFRIRHALSFAIHNFFNSEGFVYINTPIITGSDCEGAGEMFNVTTLNKSKFAKNQNGTIDYSNDFFGKETNLTVSGQLEAEMASLALGKVYTFGPTFRAENSNTSRHLAEFWMIEPEVAFSDLSQIIDLSEKLLKYSINYVLENCKNDIFFLEKRLLEEDSKKKKEERNPMNLTKKLEHTLNFDFIKINYDEAFMILKNSKPNKKKKFKFIIDQWGVDFQSEHEKYLVEKEFNYKPVVITNYPKDIKAFYMRLNNDLKTVAAMDLLFPGIGEIVGGAQREERLHILKNRMTEMKVNEKELWWYIDSRRFGTVPHGGFGLGFERLVQYVTGMSNIRDVIPFPRTPQNAEF